MSPLSEPSTVDLDQVSDQIKELIKRRPDLENQLKPIRRHLVDMKVALSELEELREEHDRGKITEDTYLTRRKKLKTDYMLARDSIGDQATADLLGQVKDQNEKSRLAKLKDAVSSNKGYILFLLELVSTILKKAQQG